MPKVTEEHRIARRTEIAQAAMRCFARKGFEGTSVADIIAESGLSAGAIYGHYKSKNELIQLAVTELLGQRMADVELALMDEDLMEPGELIGVFLRGVEAEFGDLGVLLQLWAAAANDAELRRLAQGIAGSIREVFQTYLAAWHVRRNGLSEAEAEARGARESWIYIGICQGYMVQSAIFDGFDGDAYIATSAALLAR
ncbi:TetR/AcrR family transcriptional regulator [Leifsonia sp. YIM 134122]|uniref:TetR/AcrR family transcriptional regulator n=1 Tax=Leifsonia stereocauli TaxID=3134136 RepID=A0ABU9VZK8_9MICO